MDNNMQNNMQANNNFDSIQRINAEADMVCRSFQSYTFSTLLSKRVEFMNRVNALKIKDQTYANYDKMIYDQLLFLQNNEVTAYQARIGGADYDELLVIKEEIEKKGYASNVSGGLFNQINARIMARQTEKLEAMISGYEAMSRIELRELIDKVRETGYDSNLVTNCANKLINQQNVAEQKELNDLCAKVEESDIDTLKELLTKLNEGGYKAEYAGRYVTLINNRIDFIYTEKLRSICENVSLSSRDELKEVTNKIDEVECNPAIKTQFYGMVNKRIEEIDYDELTRLTSDIEELNIDELKKLKQQIEDGSYSRKFVKEFILKVRLQLEKLQYKEVISREEQIESMSRAELENMYKEITSKDYEDRVIALEKEKIEDKIFEMDMLKLLDICNDFDSLDSKNISQVYMRSEQFDVSKKSKKIYQDRLDIRKFNYALEQIQPYAYMFSTMAQNYSVPLNNIKLAAFSPDYAKYFEVLKANCNELKEYEVPVFIWPDAPYLAMSREKLFCYIDNRLHIFALPDIHSFTAVSKFLSSTFIINLRSGQSVQLQGNAGKVGVSLANMLNQFITVLPNPPQNVAPVRIHTENFSKEEFKVSKKYDFSLAACDKDFYEKYMEFVNATNTNVLKLTNTSEWMQKQEKIRANYGISVYEPIACYYDGSFFSGNKDGIALGQNYVFVKRAGVNAAIPLEKVYGISVAPSGDKMQVECTDDNIFIIDCISLDNEKITALAGIADGYVKAVQLAKVLEDKQAKIVLEKEKKCSVCGSVIASDAIFCGKCGTRVE